MMNIDIYNPAFDEKTGYIDEFVSLIWTRKYSDPGTFELVCPLVEETTQALQLNHFVLPKDFDEPAVIETIICDESSNTITAKGRFATALLARRVNEIRRSYSDSLKVGRILYNLYNSCTSGDRKLSPLDAPAYQLSNIGVVVDVQIPQKDLLTIFTSLCRYSALGLEAVGHGYGIIQLRFYEGNIRTEGSTTMGNTPVVFSEENRNIYDCRLEKGDMNYSSKIFFTARARNDTIILQESISKETNDIRELYRDFTVELEDSSQIAMIRARAYARTLAQEALDAAEPVEAFEFSLDPDGRFKYRDVVDGFDVGDIVTVKKESWGISKDLRITEAMEVYERGGRLVYLTLGDPLPTTLNWGGLS